MPSTRLPDDTVVVASSELLATTFGEETVILNVSDGKYYGLENVGARLWTLLGKPVTVGALIGTLVAEYEVDPERCRRDVSDLLRRLEAQGLIQVRAPA
jgi:hypothetical protein